MQRENKRDDAATAAEREEKIAHVSEGENRWWSVQQINFRTEHSCQEMDGEQEGYRG